MGTDKKVNGSDSSAQGENKAVDNNTATTTTTTAATATTLTAVTTTTTSSIEKQNSTIQPDIKDSTNLHADNLSNNKLDVKVHSTTAKTNKDPTTKPTDNGNRNSTAEQIKTEPKSGFHVWSFIGGIFLFICASLMTIYGVRYYKAKRNGRQFSFRIFDNGHGFAARHDTD